MKRFLMYSLVLVVMLFLGFTTYYFVQNKENIILAFDQTETLKLNVGETFSYDDIITHTQPHDTTTIKVSVEDEDILSYNKETKIFTASGVGATVLKITPSNARFGPFVINVKVGNGLTTEFPYYISDAGELQKIGATGSVWTLDLNYEVIADIYLSNIDWTPIGHNSAYSGTFNGGGHTIHNLTITGKNYITTAGLFAEISPNGVVKNVKLDNASITGDFVSAGFVAGNNFGTVCLSSVTNSTLENTRDGAYVGGIVGQNNYTQNGNNYKSATVGMCGVEKTSFNLIGATYVGGIVGKNNAGQVENCYAVLSNVSSSKSTTYYGGIVGQNLVVDGKLGSAIKYCHAGCQSLANSGISAGIAGQTNDANTTTKNAYARNYFAINTNNFVGSTSSFTSAEIEKKDTTALKAKETYVDWDFVNVWQMGEAYAVINFDNVYSSTINDSDIDDSIDGADDIATTTDAIYEMVCDMRKNPTASKTYVVSGNHTINMSTMPWSSEAWEPIGTANSAFNGKFVVQDGSLTFTNLTITNQKYAGFFGYVGSGAIISGLKFQNVTINNNSQNINSSDAYAGAIVARLGTSSSIVNCEVTGLNISAYDNIGGVVGINYGTIQNTNVTNTIKNTLKALDASCNVGVIVGTNEGTITSSNANATIIEIASTASGNAGAIAGTNNGAINQINANQVEITSSSAGILRAGGVVGTNNKTVSNSVATNAKISLLTTSANAYAGGIAGLNATSGNISTSQVIGANISSYYAGGVTVDNFGKISKVAVGNETLGEGKIAGIYVGGLAVVNKPNATIENSGVYALLEGLTNSSNTNGFAYKLQDGSVIKNCLGAGSFAGKGGFNADTDTAYRNWWSGILQNLPWNDKMGTISNSLIVNVSGKYIQGYGALIDLFDNPILSKYDVVISDQIARGSDNFKRFTQSGFTTTNWQFTNGKLPLPAV